MAPHQPQPAEEHPITHLLHEWKMGNDQAMSRVMDLVYDQLKVMAHRYTVKERDDRTLNTTALVHDAYLKMLAQQNRAYENRSHFYAIVSTCMRRIILEVARARNTQKRGNGSDVLPIREHFLISDSDAEHILHVNQALEKLSEMDPQVAQIVEYRYFGGMKLEEIAEAMQCSLSTVKRDWRMAKNWLYNELKDH